MSEHELPIKVATIEATQHGMAQQITDIKENVNKLDKKIDDRFDKIENSLKSYFEDADKRFAAKWVEKMLYLVVTAIIGYTIESLYHLIAK